MRLEEIIPEQDIAILRPRNVGGVFEVSFVSTLALTTGADAIFRDGSGGEVREVWRGKACWDRHVGFVW
jgi:hypothetical protein